MFHHQFSQLVLHFVLLDSTVYFFKMVQCVVFSGKFVFGSIFWRKGRCTSLEDTDFLSFSIEFDPFVKKLHFFATDRFLWQRGNLLHCCGKRVLLLKTAKIILFSSPISARVIKKCVATLTYSIVYAFYYSVFLFYIYFVLQLVWCVYTITGHTLLLTSHQFIIIIFWHRCLYVFTYHHHHHHHLEKKNYGTICLLLKFRFFCTSAAMHQKTTSLPFRYTKWWGKVFVVGKSWKFVVVAANWFCCSCIYLWAGGGFLLLLLLLLLLLHFFSISHWTFSSLNLLLLLLSF